MECPAGNTTGGTGSTSKDSCYMSRSQIMYVQHISVTVNDFFSIGSGVGGGQKVNDIHLFFLI